MIIFKKHFVSSCTQTLTCKYPIDTEPRHFYRTDWETSFDLWFASDRQRKKNSKITKKQYKNKRNHFEINCGLAETRHTIRTKIRTIKTNCYWELRSFSRQEVCSLDKNGTNYGSWDDNRLTCFIYFFGQIMHPIDQLLPYVDKLIQNF